MYVPVSHTAFIRQVYVFYWIAEVSETLEVLVIHRGSSVIRTAAVQLLNLIEVCDGINQSSKLPFFHASALPRKLI